MTFRPPNESSADLEQHLARLRDDFVFPATPDIAAIFAIDDSPRSARRRGSVFADVPRSFWTAMAVAVVVIAMLVVAVPGARSTVAGWFDFDGIRIEIGTDDRTPTSPPTTIGENLFLGQPVTFADAAAVVPFDIVAPVDGRTTGPPESYLLQRDGGMIVSLLYPPTSYLPEVGTTGVGLLLMQIDSSDSTDLLAKRSMNERPPVPVTVNGEVGAWIEGGTLTVEPVYDSGAFERSSGNVLIWEEDGVTYRMESGLSMADALAIAESLRPLTAGDSPPPSG